MRVSIVSAAGVSVAALALAGTVAPMAGASDAKISPSHHGVIAQHVVPMKRGNCYSNMQNDAGNAINSQDFEADFDIYDDMAADSFSVKKTCKVTGVYAPGQYYNGSGPATAETVTFYADDNGEPGAVEASQTVTGDDSGGSFMIPLDTVALSPGKHWVSVVAQMDFATGGQWGWELTSNVKGSTEGQWENPNGGFGVCPTWDDVTVCTGSSGDFMVTLLK